MTGEELRSFEWIAGFNKLEAVGEVKSADVRACDTAHERHYHRSIFTSLFPSSLSFLPLLLIAENEGILGLVAYVHL